MSLFALYSDENERLKKKLACLKTCRSFSNGMGALINPYTNFPAQFASLLSAQINATGESVSILGEITISDGSSQKTFSSAGGKVHFISSGNVFANAGTRLRAGVQDVLPTGIEDGVFDVSGDFVGGTNPIVDGIVTSIPMGTGSRVITNGEFIAISVEMITRAGADSISIIRNYAAFGGIQTTFPYLTQDTGAGPAKTPQGVPQIVIEFDDGTLGYMGTSFPLNITSGFSFPASTPNEYATVFTLPLTANLSGVLMNAGNGGTDLEVAIYSNPLGTDYPYLPQLEWSKTIEGDLTSASAASTASLFVKINPGFRVIKGKQYAISVKPLTGGSLYWSTLDFGDEAIKQATPLGTDWMLGYRNNNTSVFTVDTTKLYGMGLYLSDFYC